VHSKLHR